MLGVAVEFTWGHAFSMQILMKFLLLFELAFSILCFLENRLLLLKCQGESDLTVVPF